MITKTRLSFVLGGTKENIILKHHHLCFLVRKDNDNGTSGECEEARTLDSLLKREVLYLLSYTLIKSVAKNSITVKTSPPVFSKKDKNGYSRKWYYKNRLYGLL